MNEWQQVALVALRMLVLSGFVTLYIVGGRKQKFFRRIFGGSFLTLSCIGISLLSGTFSWWLIPAFTPLSAGLFMGYGADSLSDKIWRRGLYGICLGFTAIILGFMNGAHILGCFQFLTAITASVLIGVTNETPAVSEEALIAGFSVFAIPFLV